MLKVKIISLRGKPSGNTRVKKNEMERYHSTQIQIPALKRFIRQTITPFAMRNDNSQMQTGKAFTVLLNF